MADPRQRELCRILATCRHVANLLPFWRAVDDIFRTTSARPLSYNPIILAVGFPPLALMSKGPAASSQRGRRPLIFAIVVGSPSHGISVFRGRPFVKPVEFLRFCYTPSLTLSMSAYPDDGNCFTRRFDRRCGTPSSQLKFLQFANRSAVRVPWANLFPIGMLTASGNFSYPLSFHSLAEHPFPQSTSDHGEIWGFIPVSVFFQQKGWLCLLASADTYKVSYRLRGI